MYCANCGQQIDDDSVFCANCGAPQDEAVPAAESANAPVGTSAPESAPASQEASGGSPKVPLIIAAVVLVVVAVIIAAFFLLNPTDGPENSASQEPSASSAPSSSSSKADDLEARTVKTEFFTFVMPAGWEGKVTWTLDHTKQSSPRGKGYPDQELFWYYFYLTGGDKFKDQVMAILVANDATAELGQTMTINEFTAGNGFTGYVCFFDSFLVGGKPNAASATIASLQSGGQVHYSESDSKDKNSADMKVIEKWMKENVVPGITASSVASTQATGFSGITSVRASSVLPTDSVNARDYSAASIIDGDFETCWSENVSGPGINEYVAFSGPSEQTFSGFAIRNGHQASERLYYLNARATSLRVIVDGEVKETVSLADSGLGWQTVTFARPYTGKEIALQIDTAVSGSSYDDCCITEVEFF